MDRFWQCSTLQKWRDLCLLHLYSNDIYNESDVNVFTPKFFGCTLQKPILTTHTRCFFAPHWLSVGQHVTAASRTGFWCDADRVGDLLNRCLRKTWWHQSLVFKIRGFWFVDNYLHIRLARCGHWCFNMFQPSFLYRISPTSYFLLQHPHVFCDWPFFQVQNQLRTHQLRNEICIDSRCFLSLRNHITWFQLKRRLV